MKILIIGSKGFIGSHCVSYFNKKHEVYTCDVVVDYTTKNYFLIDATNASFDDVFRATSFDLCINCSGAASVQDSIQNPQRDFLLNTHNVFKQLDALRKHNASCKYINLSSAAVYGNPKYLPIDEIHPLNPISPYGHHKKMAEEICKEFYDCYGIATTSLRIFSAYGPGLQKQLFWDLFQKQSVTKDIVMFGTGMESRDFIYISDLVAAIEIVSSKSTFTGNSINVANGEEFTIEHIADLYFSLIDSAITFSFGGEKRKGDPVNWVADNGLLASFGYKPSYTLKDGLTNYITWRRKLG